MPKKLPVENEEIKQNQKEANRCKMIIRNLENNEGFKALIKDLERTKGMLDNSWYLTSDRKILRDMQLRAYGTTLMVNILDKYKAIEQKANSEIKRLKNPDTHINKDWDNN